MSEPGVLNDEFIGLRIPSDLRKDTDEAARKRGVSRSAIVKIALADYLLRRRER